jgi:DNA-binding ferritin-like protein
MSQQQYPQVQQRQPQGVQKPQQQQIQQGQQTFDQFLPQQVSQVVYELEQLESDAEWAHGRAMQAGDSYTAKTLADISQIVHLQKNLLLRKSEFAQTFGQAVQQTIQRSSQQLQQSQITGVKQVLQQAEQVAQTIPQASAQVGQQGQQGQMGQMSQQQQIGGQSRFQGQTY